ncbi:MAG: hypothetical protein Q4C49_01045 [Bacillota bacterium]|nr:hypothetical protein [Bacillota bacterium]
MKDNPTWDDVELAYKRGATEQRDIDEEEGDIAQQENILNAINKQKQIDIVKACQEFCRNCRIHNDMIGNDCECSQLKDFYKALRNSYDN